MVVLQWERAAVTRGGYMASRASLFAALHESEIGPKRRFVALRRYVRSRGEADMPRHGPTRLTPSQTSDNAVAFFSFGAHRRYRGLGLSHL